jgi:phosphatidylglycerophosphate synthase
MFDFYPQYNRKVKQLLSPFLSAIPKFITPNFLTFVNLFFSICAGVYIYLTGDPWGFLGLLLTSMLFDFIDGPLARYRGQDNALGKNLDTALDTTAEILIYTSLYLSNLIDFQVLLAGLVLFIIIKISRSITKFDIGTRRSALFGYILIRDFNLLAQLSIAINALAICTGLILYKLKFFKKQNG